MKYEHEFVSVDAARKLVLDHVRPAPLTTIPLAGALGRVLANPIVCDIDFPPFDKAMMDGYAVRSADIGSGETALKVVGRVPAGSRSTRSVGAMQAVRINTGAPLPAGADAVVRVEDTELSRRGAKVKLKSAVAAGAHVDPRAKHVSAGAVVVKPGVRMDAEHLSIAAAAGADRVTVYRQPTVSLLVTGDELVDVKARPKGAQIRNSNGIMLDALVRGAFAQPVNLGVARDDKKVLKDRIRRGLASDFLCISGGVSMGFTDFVPEALESCGVRTVFRRMAIKPGKPTLFGVAPSGACVFALPGNPMAGFVVFQVLVRLALEAREGRHDRGPTRLTARLVGRMAATGNRRGHWPARLTGDGDGQLVAEALSWYGSSDLFGFCAANGLIDRHEAAPAAESGDSVTVLPFGRL